MFACFGVHSENGSNATKTDQSINISFLEPWDAPNECLLIQFRRGTPTSSNTLRPCSTPTALCSLFPADKDTVQKIAKSPCCLPSKLSFFFLRQTPQVSLILKTFSHPIPPWRASRDQKCFFENNLRLNFLWPSVYRLGSSHGSDEQGNKNNDDPSSPSHDEMLHNGN